VTPPQDDLSPLEARALRELQARRTWTKPAALAQVLRASPQEATQLGTALYRRHLVRHDAERGWIGDLHEDGLFLSDREILTWSRSGSLVRWRERQAQATARLPQGEVIRHVVRASDALLVLAYLPFSSGGTWLRRYPVDFPAGPVGTPEAQVRVDGDCDRLSVSADGRLVAVSGGEGDLRPHLLSTADLSQVRALETSKVVVRVRATAFTPDGRFLVGAGGPLGAAGAGYGLAWSVETGERLDRLSLPSAGEALTVFGQGDELRIDVGTNFTGLITYALSPEGRLEQRSDPLKVGSERTKVRDGFTSSASMRASARSADGRCVYLGVGIKNEDGQEEGSIQVWELSDHGPPRLLRASERFPGMIDSLTFSPTRDLLLVGLEGYGQGALVFAGDDGRPPAELIGE
jgi:hypothetical protein